MSRSRCQLPGLGTGFRMAPSHLRTGPSVGGPWPSLLTLGSGTAGLTVGRPWPLPLSPLGEKSVQLVMEYVPLGSLRDYLPRHSVGLAQLLLFAQQICEVGRPAPACRTCPSSLAWPECPIFCLPDPAPGLTFQHTCPSAVSRSPGHTPSLPVPQPA